MDEISEAPVDPLDSLVLPQLTYVIKTVNLVTGEVGFEKVGSWTEGHIKIVKARRYRRPGWPEVASLQQVDQTGLMKPAEG
jgi:hypothetical protein